MLTAGTLQTSHRVRLDNVRLEVIHSGESMFVRFGPRVHNHVDGSENDSTPTRFPEMLLLDPLLDQLVYLTHGRVFVYTVVTDVVLLEPVDHLCAQIRSPFQYLLANLELASLGVVGCGCIRRNGPFACLGLLNRCMCLQPLQLDAFPFEGITSFIILLLQSTTGCFLPPWY